MYRFQTLGCIGPLKLFDIYAKAIFGRHCWFMSDVLINTIVRQVPDYYALHQAGWHIIIHVIGVEWCPIAFLCEFLLLMGVLSRVKVCKSVTKVISYFIPNTQSEVIFLLTCSESTQYMSRPARKPTFWTLRKTSTPDQPAKSVQANPGRHIPS